MRILSLDTSFSTFNFSAIEDGKVSFLHYEKSQRKLLEYMPSILKRYGLHPKDFDAYAVSVGVGYATSLRAGITFIKTWAYMNSKPVIAYATLHMMLLYRGCELFKCALLRVSSKVFYRRLGEEGLSEVKLLREPPVPSNCLCLKEQMECKGALELFPFSAYGGLWAHKRLTEGYTGDDPFTLEPLQFSSP